MFEKLKKRWNIRSSFQVIIILVVFAVTGSTTVYVKKAIFDLIGINTETYILLKVPAYIIILVTVYNILLLFIGSIFGQFRFFWEFEKKFFGRLFYKKKPVATEKVKV